MKRRLRIAGWALGLSLAMAGIGAAVGASQGAPVEAGATWQPCYTLATTKNTSNTGYASTYDITVDGKIWNVPGNQNNEGFVRIGGKGGDESTSVQTVDRIITGKSSLDSAIVNVKINHNGTSDKGAVVNSVKLTVASNETFDTDVSEVTINAPSISKGVAGSLSFVPTLPSTEWAKDSYYKITFNMTLTGSKNYGLDVNSIVFYEDVINNDYATNLTAAPSSIAPEKAALVVDALSELSITAEKNGGASAAYSNYSAKIVRIDDSIEDVISTTKFKIGDKGITLTANDPMVAQGEQFSSTSISVDVKWTPAITIGNTYAMIYDNPDPDVNNEVFNCSFSSSIGGHEGYETTPAGFGLVVEDGFYSGKSYSLRIASGSNANKYVSWNGTSGKLVASATKTALASWFVFDNGTEVIIANTTNDSATMRYNVSSPRFACYTSNTGANPSLLPLGTVNCDTFAADYMKMGTYDPDHDGTGATGACKGASGYYAAAKTYFNETLTGAERALICDENGLYADAYARLLNWAAANGDEIDVNDNTLVSAYKGIVGGLANNDPTAIVVAGLIGGMLLATGFGVLVIRRKKQK